MDLDEARDGGALLANRLAPPAGGPRPVKAGVVVPRPAPRRRLPVKRIVLALSSMMRNFAMGCRRRMNEADSKKDEADAKRAKTGTARPETAEDDTQVEGSRASIPLIDLEPSRQGQATLEQTAADVIS